MTFQLPLACDGCFKGAPAVISLVIIVLALIGSIYMLLASNFGARKAYLILMVSLGAWMMIQSAIWLFGVPGTTTATGPRGREPQWIPFTPTSQVAREDFAQEIGRFPQGWDTISSQKDKTYPGNISAQGEFENIRAAVTDALARLDEKQGRAAVKTADWRFHPTDLPAVTPEEKEMTEAQVAFLLKDNTLLFGATIEGTAKHPATTVFAYRDKGLVYFPSLVFLVVSLAIFAVHMWLLVRVEEREKTERARLEPTAA